MLRTCAILELVILFAVNPLYAASSSPKPAPAQPPGQKALEHYHKGLEHQQRAWDHEERAAAARPGTHSARITCSRRRNLRRVRSPEQKKCRGSSSARTTQAQGPP
jgi:hypothetical protein